MAISNGEAPKHETVMDVTVEQIARVYAQAFMGVAEKSGNADALVDELKSLVVDVLDRFPQFEQALKSSLISHEEKEELLGRIFDKSASPQVLNFLKVLSRHGRLELLRPIVWQVDKLHTERSGRADVEVRVAHKVDDSLRSDLQSRLQKMLGKQLNLNILVDPSLVAGIVVRVGDRVYDGSVRTQLEHTRHAMVERAVEQIETRPERFLASAG
jgi:F-type H+-transporting ATPase subunit delta